MPVGDHHAGKPCSLFVVFVLHNVPFFVLHLRQLATFSPGAEPHHFACGGAPHFFEILDFIRAEPHVTIWFL